MTGLRAGRGSRAGRGRPRLGQQSGLMGDTRIARTVTNGQSVGAGRGAGAIVGRVIVHAMTDLFGETERNEPAGGPLPRVVSYTDGACKRNPNGPGGWGVVLPSGPHRKELHGLARHHEQPDGTNRRDRGADRLERTQQGRAVHRQRVRPQGHHRVDPQLEETRPPCRSSSGVPTGTGTSRSRSSMPHSRSPRACSANGKRPPGRRTRVRPEGQKRRSLAHHELPIRPQCDGGM
jgi:hypothetical protein